MDHTEEEYYLHLVATLDESDDGVMDHVASLVEWRRLKNALHRWIDDKDAEMDRFAAESEHDAG